MTAGDQRLQSAHRGDAAQGATFRAALDSERERLLARSRERRPIIDRPEDAGGARVSLTSNEVQLRHIDRLIAKLDSRFTPDEGGDEEVPA